MKRKWLVRIAIAGAAAAAMPVSAQPQAIDRPGTYIHQAAGAAFPERVGEFQRRSLHRYDAEGVNVSANYSLERPEGRLHLTVYVYPAPPHPSAAARADICRQEFEASRQIIANQNAGAERIDDGAAPTARDVAGHRSVYRFATRFDGSEQDVRSEIDLYCHVGGQWQVKYRATSPAALDATQDIETFIRTGPWPGRAADPDTIAFQALPAASTRPAP